MTEVIASYAGSLLVVGLTVSYVAGVPKLDQIKQSTRVLFNALLGCLHFITRIF
jgi:hypothetical protein